MRTRTILLADDEEIIRKSLGRELRAEGYEVTAVESGEGAVALLEQKQVDLVITDLRMDGLDGIGVLKQTKAMAPELPVIILTGYGDMASAINALRLGADDYILKPCDMSELIFRMSRCFEKQDLLRQLQVQNLKLQEEVTARLRVEDELRRFNDRLELRVKERTRELEDTNLALKVMLDKREQDKVKVEEQLLINVKQLVEPYLLKLKKSGLDDQQKYYAEIIESNLEEVVSPIIRSLSPRYLNLTPTEIQVANLVKQGKTTKEIAELLNIAPSTVDGHRKNIRKKVGITNQKTNLRDLISSAG
jgi:DNA-binding NarL/FixJ family response regulator